MTWLSSIINKTHSFIVSIWLVCRRSEAFKVFHSGEILTFLYIKNPCENVCTAHDNGYTFKLRSVDELKISIVTACDEIIS